MVLKKGSLMTSGQTAGHGLPHIRLQQVKQNDFFFLILKSFQIPFINLFFSAIFNSF